MRHPDDEVYHPMLISQFDGLVVERGQVFTLADGTVVIQWHDARIQELITGLYRAYDAEVDYGHAITDYELAQLRMSNRVHYYDKRHVWLCPLPQAGRFGQRRVFGKQQGGRAYYLQTSHPPTHLELIRRLLADLRLTRRFAAKIRNERIVLLAADGKPYATLEEALIARRIASESLPDILDDLAVAFIEKSVDAHMNKDDMTRDTENHTPRHLNENIFENVSGKLVVLALNDEDERLAFSEMLAQMQLHVKHALSAFEALEVLEDYEANLFVMDIQLPDMHGWSLLHKIKEIENLRDLPVLVIIDQPHMGNTVAKVDYLMRPVSIARLRQNVIGVLSE